MNDEKMMITKDEVVALIHEVVNQTLTSLGVGHAKPLEMQRDFLFLREVRCSTERVKRRTLILFAGAIVVGLLTLLGFGIQVWIMSVRK